MSVGLRDEPDSLKDAVAVATGTASSIGAPGPGLRRLANLRDLGGLPARAARRIRPGVLLRSDAPHDDDDPPLDVVWPPRVVLDLRAPGEVRELHPLRETAEQIVSISLAAGSDSTEIVAHHDDVRTLYLAFLEDRAEQLAAAVRTVARSPTPLLVHCAAGKDRTGLVVAIVLDAVGVDRDAIVADYHLTEQNMGAVVARVRENLNSVDALMELIVQRPSLVRAPKQAIRTALEWLDAQPGGVRGWLAGHGVDRRDFDRLEQKLLTSIRTQPSEHTETGTS